MKKYWKELPIAAAQVVLFYILPLFAGPTDAMGMVVLILLGTFALGLVLGLVSRSDLKWAFPAFAAVLFLPTIPLYYNFSAMIHALWYLVDGALGLALGSALAAMVRWICRKK